jgi:hypothetical protein
MLRAVCASTPRTLIYKALLNCTLWSRVYVTTAIDVVLTVFKLRVRPLAHRSRSFFYLLRLATVTVNICSITFPNSY